MDKLILNIQENFGSPKPPKFPEWRPEWKTSEAYEETAYFDGKTWNELQISDFEIYTCCHTFFPEHCALYYLGANMYWECRSRKFHTYAMERLLMGLDSAGFSIRKRRRFSSRIETLWRSMNEGQKFTLLAYLDRFGEQAELHVEEIRNIVQGYRDALQRL
ncbi:hypothetical protein [Leisingera thetidis]|uniref:hypothetical protein n=1 Tax=Leisingera thetidis TaxID=2930199 RepID=UPI0021F7BCDA|nr:hypothetical protein [Leisingera thetidis]